MTHDVYIWAVDVSRWNAVAYSRVEGKNTQRLPWMDALDEEIAFFLDAYDTKAAAKVRRYLRGVDRIRALVATVMARVMLMENDPTCAWKDIEITTTPGGRPYVKQPATVQHWDWNASHDGDWVVMAYTKEGRVGADVMEVGLPSFEKSSRTFCETLKQSMTSAEYEWILESGSEDLMLSRLMDLWTYKEAFTKNIGAGLGFDFRRVQVLRDANDDMALSIDGQRNDRYRFIQVDLPHGQAQRSHTNHSRIAVVHGPLPAPYPGQHAPVPCTEAQQQGWLRTWTVDEFLDYAHTQHQR
ncbi:lysine biosynthesis protein [Malassezia pachydermatis]|uniref:holo-[acyl-carrier-protein] synthase n=1 Tax=Malassezia pachydermatis TaxID=77020 RepID=A0A0N0RSC9_9BASI|nr:bna2-tryptophan -dioxygenase [Malassezia pachydermatis]KOS14745.1 bna2-tryptophan -dioxygenase [Malassezia pachydermatis]